MILFFLEIIEKSEILEHYIKGEREGSVKAVGDECAR
jgi:hypothetical protein